ncbi:MAG: hypothetical protein IJC70_06640, partial [Firmicutes bacterium]|nr:hypothetical protein [Bacillota bacterium]
LWYRRLAAAVYPEQVQELADQLQSHYGMLPQPAVNLVDRCCIKALAEVGLAQPRYVPLIVAALDALDAGQYPESMRPLIERDVAEAKRRLAAD